MKVVSKSLKGLRKAKTADDKVKLVREAQVATLNSLKYLPKMFVSLKDGKAKAKATADYRRLVGLSYVKLCELELAFLEGDEEKAGKVTKELKGLKKEGHKAYIED